MMKKKNIEGIFLFFLLILCSSFAFAIESTGTFVMEVKGDTTTVTTTTYAPTVSSRSSGSSGGGGISCNLASVIESGYCRDTFCPRFFKTNDCSQSHTAKHLCCEYYYRGVIIDIEEGSAVTEVNIIGSTPTTTTEYPVEIRVGEIQEIDELPEPGEPLELGKKTWYSGLRIIWGVGLGVIVLVCIIGFFEIKTYMEKKNE